MVKVSVDLLESYRADICVILLPENESRAMWTSEFAKSSLCSWTIISKVHRQYCGFSDPFQNPIDKAALDAPWANPTLKTTCRGRARVCDVSLHLYYDGPWFKWCVFDLSAKAWLGGGKIPEEKRGDEAARRGTVRSPRQWSQVQVVFLLLRSYKIHPSYLLLALPV